MQQRVCLFFLTATYSIVIFGLMLLSLLETIVVTYLLDKDQVLQRELWLKKQEEISNDQQEAGESSQLILHRLECFSANMGCFSSIQSLQSLNVPVISEKAKTLCWCIFKTYEREKPGNVLLEAEEVKNKNMFA